MALDGPRRSEADAFPWRICNRGDPVCFSRSASCSLHAPGRHGDCFPTPAHKCCLDCCNAHSAFARGHQLPRQLTTGAAAVPLRADSKVAERRGRDGQVAGGISPPGAPRTAREPLDSYGSRCSTVGRRAAGFASVHGLLLLQNGVSWPVASAEQRSPFGPTPLQSLRPYYEPLRPSCSPHRYSRPRGFSRL